MEDIEEVNVEAKEEADYEAKEDISDRVTPNTTQLSPTGEEAHEGTSLTIETSAIYHKGITSTTSSQDHDDVSINTFTRVLRSSRRHTKSITSPELPNVEQPSTPATELDEEYSANPVMILLLAITNINFYVILEKHFTMHLHHIMNP